MKKVITKVEAVDMANRILEESEFDLSNHKVTDAKAHGDFIELSFENGTPNFDGKTIERANHELKEFFSTYKLA